MSGRGGLGIVELLVGTALALVVLGALAGAVGTGARVLAAAGARGEVEDALQAALESFAFDLRRAGFDPAAAGIPALADAAADRLTTVADLDGDGVVDGTSEETTGWVCGGSPPRLSRIVGRQSLPLVDGLGRCELSYLDAAGSAVAVPAAGLGAADRARVRAVGIALEARAPGLRTPSARRVAVALRTAP
ncbi:MAG TPA: hypothetical protein VFD84_15510 [Candidatus Binatia bacterium]|nr:hypothetical protein [Candidatus Binatia bacterium]